LHVRQHCWTSVDFFSIWRYLNFRARYPSGKGEVCKTFMRRFDSDPRLHRYFLYFRVTNSNITYFVGVAGLRGHAASTSSNRTNYCDHAVTSAGVRLSVGNGLRNPGTSCFKKTESNLGQATRPCRCVGESQVVTPERPSHPPLSPPPCRIGTAELGVRALCEMLPARLRPLGPTASRPTLLRASCRWRICRATASDPK
jgi:hypothetical protein